MRRNFGKEVARNEGWRFSAPEAYALLNGSRAKGEQVLRLALLELIVRGRLRLRMARSILRLQTPALYAGQDGSAHLTPALEELLRLRDRRARRSWRADGRVYVGDLAKSACAKHTTSWGFMEQRVLVPLEARRLYRRRTVHRLGFIPDREWEPTAAGEETATGLRKDLALGERDFRGWTDRDRSRALRYLDLMGPAVLLAPRLYPDIRRLGEDLRSSPTRVLDFTVFDVILDMLPAFDAAVAFGARQGDAMGDG